MVFIKLVLLVHILLFSYFPTLCSYQLITLFWSYIFLMTHFHPAKYNKFTRYQVQKLTEDIWTDIELYHLKNCPQLLDFAWSCAWIDLSATSHDCSIGVMSGEHGGHTIHWNSPECSLKQLWVTWAWWHSALSCCNNSSLLEDMEFLWVNANSHKVVQFYGHWSMMYLGRPIHIAHYGATNRL